MCATAEWSSSTSGLFRYMWSAAYALLTFNILLSVLNVLRVECVDTASVLVHKYSTRIVRTKYGPLRGVIVHSHPPVEAFLGVPYATPPLGSLRYMPPVTPSMWRNTRLADRFSAVCPQKPPNIGNRTEALLELPRGRLLYLEKLLPLLANQSEDCLYLNLYVPRAASGPEGINAPIPCILYVHGESYEWNSGNPYDGTVLASLGHVIVVTINFRLGVLGFLKTGAKSSAQGNFGLMDLVAGLHWLRENLPAFGGDPERITLMGHGTGAALANFIAVSPVAKELLHRVVLLSGSGLSPWALQREPLAVKRRVAMATECHGDLVEEDLAPCLRTKSLQELLSIQVNPPRFLPGFAPFIDGTVLLNPSPTGVPLPTQSGGTSSTLATSSGFELADFVDRDLLFGLTSTESYLDLSAQDLEFGFNETRRDRILRTYVRNSYYYHLNEIFSTLKNEYTDWERPMQNPLSVRDATLEVLSDGHTAAPLIRVGYLHALRGGKTYFLHFVHQSSERDFPQRPGSVRGEDVPYVLGLPLVNGGPFFPHNYTPADTTVARLLIHYLSNFARKGDPNGDRNLNSRNEKKSNVPSSMMTGLSNMAGGILHTTSTTTNHNNIDNNIAKKNGGNNGGSGISSNTGDNRLAGSSASSSISMASSGINFQQSQQQYTIQQMIMGNDDVSTMTAPFWDTYDTINQLYLALGTKPEMKNHYRGHKMSLWLNLIPQLHRPGDGDDFSMRHHHMEEGAQFYDGSVRPQSMQRPTNVGHVISNPPPVSTRSPQTTTVSTTSMGTPQPTPKSDTALQATTTECPPNITLADMSSNTNDIGLSSSNNNNLLRKLASSHYQSYTTALTVTIAVGCFLLLLNILIFAGIYHKRDRSRNRFGPKKKEDLAEAGSCSSSSGETYETKMIHHHAYDTRGTSAGVGAGSNAGADDSACSKSANYELTTSMPSGTNYECKSGNFLLGEYSGTTPPTNCSYEKTNLIFTEKLRQPNNNDNTSLELQEFNSSPPSGVKRNEAGQQILPPAYLGTTDNPFVNNSKIETDDTSPNIPEPPPPPKGQPPSSLVAGGILRPQGGPTTPGTMKKRVQIQEISV